MLRKRLDDPSALREPAAFLAHVEVELRLAWIASDVGDRVPAVVQQILPEGTPSKGEFVDG